MTSKSVRQRIVYGLIAQGVVFTLCFGIVIWFKGTDTQLRELIFGLCFFGAFLNNRSIRFVRREIPSDDSTLLKTPQV